MIEWYPELYQDIHTQKQWRKLRRRAEKKKLLPTELMFICIASNPHNLLDILQANALLYPYYQKRDILVVGTAFGMEAAKELIEQMMFDIYTKTNGFDVRGYFVIPGSKSH